MTNEPFTPQSDSTTPASARTGAPIVVLICNGSLCAGDDESRAVTLANSLADEGLAVLFAADDGPLRSKLNIRVKYLPIENVHQALTHAAHDLSHLLSQERPDVVHSHDDTCALAAALAVKASKTGCARVLTHNTGAFRHVPRFISGAIMRRCADRFIAISKDRFADLTSFGIPGEKILSIPRLLDRDAGTAPASEPRDDPRADARDTIQVYRDLLAARTP